MVRNLLAGYPSLKDVHDPEGYIASLITILTIFELEDALNGVATVARTCEFPPSRYELRQACEAALNLRRPAPWRDEYHERSQGQLAERDRFEREAKSESAEQRRYTADDFRAFLRDPQAQAEWARKRGLRRPEDAASAPIDPKTGRYPSGTVLHDYEASAGHGAPISEGDPRHSRHVGKDPTPTRGARPAPRPARPYTDAELRAIYGIHPSFQNKTSS